MFVLSSLLEIEAKEACDWLRAAGFPQYAQLYEGKLEAPFFFFFFFFIYLLLTTPGLHCCSQAVSSCNQRGPLPSCGAQASHCGGFSCCRARALEHRLNGCGARAQLLSHTWDLPGPGIKPVSPALAGGFQTPGPPKKSHAILL